MELDQQSRHGRGVLSKGLVCCRFFVGTVSRCCFRIQSCSCGGAVHGDAIFVVDLSAQDTSAAQGEMGDSKSADLALVW